MTFPTLLYLLLTSFFTQDQWRIVFLDGSVTAVRGEVLLSAQDLAGVRSAWAWSEATPPRRVEVGAIGTSGPAVQASSWLQVQVALEKRGKGASQVPPGARVIAAPVEMWREVPEHQLPSWPVPAGGRLVLPHDSRRPWRLRLAGQDQGSWWTDVPAGGRAALLAPGRSAGLAIEARDPAGKPVPGVQATVTEATARQGAVRFWATERGEGGRIALPGLPDGEEIALTLTRPGFAPAVLRGLPGDLPRTVRLGRGAVLTGRFTSGDGRPVADARVTIEAWASPETPQLLTFGAESAGDGSWEIAGVPPGKAALLAQAPGAVPLRETIEAGEGRNDLGVRVLVAGRALAVQVVDDAGQPVAGARVQAGPGIATTTDARGRARLTGLPPDAPIEVTATAERHLQGKARANPPSPAVLPVELRRAFTVTGRFLEQPGVPAEGARARVRQGATERELRLAAERFSLDLSPGEGASLTLSSPATRDLRLTVPAGEPGEIRDLGDLLAPPGLNLTGRIVRADDASPVPGARVWLPRPGPDGPAVAWSSRDLLEARSGEDGRFRLGGLPPGPALVRIEAAGHARAHLDLNLAGDAPSLDTGDIALGAGATVRVTVDESPPGALARADLRGGWLELDMLTAAVRDGEAVFRHVPPGRAIFSVLDGRRLLCEQEVEIPTGGEVGVDCARSGMEVVGVVLVGGVAAGPGLLSWQPPAPEFAGRIDNTLSPGGLRHQQVFGAGRPQVDVAVAADGTFQTEELRPGEWRVSWLPDSGAASAPLGVQIPEVERFEARITLPGQGVSGRVVQEEGGEPVAGARVQDLVSGALTFSREDGGFSMTGLAPSRAALQARLADRSSPLVEVDLSDGNAPESVVLTLGDRPPLRIEVRVTATDGSPVPGAFVFLEEEGKGLRILTSGPDGRTEAAVEPPLAPRVRAAVTTGAAWAFGSWAGEEESRRGLALQLGQAAGSLRVESETMTGSPKVLTADGWDLSWLLTLLGSRPELDPGRPVLLSGLPPGSYTVSFQSLHRSAEVLDGERATFRFP